MRECHYLAHGVGVTESEGGRKDCGRGTEERTKAEGCPKKKKKGEDGDWRCI